MKITRLQIPDIDFDEMFESCTATIRNTEKRNRDRFYGYLDVVKINNNNYIKSMKEYEDFEEHFPFYSEPEEYATFKEDMNWLYTNKYSAEGSLGRQFYKLIRENVKNQRCPYCLHSDIDELDHYLPKSVYPSLAVTTENLVPACHTCNNKKLEKKDLFPHPYFDNLDMYTFLKCEIIFLTTDKGVLVKYEIDESSVPPSLFTRIKNFADITGRLNVYSLHAASEFSEVEISFRGLMKYGRQCLQDHLYDVSKGKELVLGQNCWQAVFYRGLIECIDELIGYLEIKQMEENL